MFKGVNKTAVFEIAFGVALAIMLVNLMSAAFSRVPILGHALDGNLEDAEDAEDAENFGGGRARRQARREGRRSRRANKRKMKLHRIKKKFSDKMADDEDKYGYNPEEEEPEQEPEYEQEEAA